MNKANGMNNPLVKLILILCLLLSSMQVNAGGSSWYIGTAFGRVIVDRNVTDFDDGSITSGRIDDKDSGWKLFGGYRYNRYLGLEFGHASLNNDLDSTTTFTGQSDGSGTDYAVGPVSVDIDDPKVWYLAAVGRVPMPLGPAPYDDRLALIGKIGGIAWDATETTIDSSGQTKRDRDGTNLMVGIGVEYQWETGLAVRSETEFYKGIAGEQYELYALAVTYNF